MTIKLSGRYEEGSDKERAHHLLVKCEIKVDNVFGVEELKPGMEESPSPSTARRRRRSQPTTTSSA